MKTTEQYRAQAAWEQISELTKSNQLDEEFISAANGAASLIQSAGLGQAVAFWLAKGKRAPLKLTDFLAQWLLKAQNSNVRDTNKRGKDLMQTIIEIDSMDYRLLVTEAMAYLNWVKRFAKARNKED